MFYSWCFFSFFIRRATSELPRPIAAKLCHMIAIWVFFVMQVQKFRGPPQRNWGPIGAISDNFRFDREYLRKGTRYPKSERRVITSYFLPRSTKKDRRTLVHRELYVSLDPPKLHFSGDYISTHRGCWPLKFQHALQIDQRLVAHIPTGTGVPKKLWANM